MPTINDAWKKYEAEVVPKAAGHEQRESMRQSFFVGALAAFNRIFEGDFKHRKQQQFEAMRAELSTFVSEVMTEAAEKRTRH